MATSRRFIFLGSASVAAIAASGFYITSVKGLTPTDYFYENKKDGIPYDFARGYFDQLIDKEIDQARKLAGFKYSDDDIKRIKTRTWDHAHYVLSEFYEFKR